MGLWANEVQYVNLMATVINGHGVCDRSIKTKFLIRFSQLNLAVLSNATPNPYIVVCLDILGVVPACRSLDCISVFASSVEDGAEVVRAISREEGLLSDPTRRVPTTASAISPDSFTFAVPGQDFLDFMGPGGSSVANGSFACCLPSSTVAVCRCQ